jgi:hypothetical protein
MSQLALFEPEAPVVRPAPAAGTSIGRHQRDRVSALIACPLIEAELMEIFHARPDDWLSMWDFMSFSSKRSIGFGLGHKLYSMSRRGLIEEKTVYLGKGLEAHRPGSPDYQGFRHEYRLAREATQGETE